VRRKLESEENEQGAFSPREQLFSVEIVCVRACVCVCVCVCTCVCLTFFLCDQASRLLPFFRRKSENRHTHASELFLQLSDTC
jgi:hypothetical protein